MSDEEDQLSELCDTFNFDPEEFKPVPAKPKQSGRYEEDAVNTVFENMPSNKINQLGLGPKILELKRRGFSLEAIHENLCLGEADIGIASLRKWWDTFQSMSPRQKNVFAKVMNENSVFNVTAQLENTFRQLNEMADSIKENPELWLGYAVEIRNQLKFAKELIQSMNLEEKRDKEMEIVLSVIREMDPKAAMTVVKKLQEYRATRNMLGG